MKTVTKPNTSAILLNGLNWPASSIWIPSSPGLPPQTVILLFFLTNNTYNNNVSQLEMIHGKLQHHPALARVFQIKFADVISEFGHNNNIMLTAEMNIEAPVFQQ
jgi:hypothetical protein